MKRKSTDISEEEIAEYLVKKLQKKSAGGFVWKKKIGRDVARGFPVLDMLTSPKRHIERMEEVEKLKRQREESALKKARREEEIALLTRERARAEFQYREKKEEEFDLQQMKSKSKIRVHEGRTKAIDVLSIYLNHSSDVRLDIESNEPYLLFKGLSFEEIEELYNDIKIHVDLDKANTEYWEALMVICEWKLAQSRRKDAQESGLHSSIETDIMNLLDGKTYMELEAMQIQIESQIRSGAAKIVEYWEDVLKRIHIYKAKAYLKENHTKMFRKLLDTDSYSPNFILKEDTIDELEEDVGSFSPRLLPDIENEEVVDPEEDMAMLERERKDVVKAFETEIMKAIGARKPKYSYKVHSGYEWNKYNRTHYDHDNPPPKSVQGYKFSIFYPDLMDKSKAPTYVIGKDGSNANTCIIKFRAGPPYVDIAFRIPNKEWDYSAKKGFKCTYERGVLHLYFNFKRHCYRR